MLRFYGEAELRCHAGGEFVRIDPPRLELSDRLRLQPHSPQLIARDTAAEPLKHCFYTAELDQHTANVKEQYAGSCRVVCFHKVRSVIGASDRGWASRRYHPLRGSEGQEYPFALQAPRGCSRRPVGYQDASHRPGREMLFRNR